MSIKKVFTGMLVAVVAFGAAATANAQSYTFTRSLQLGARGADVQNLQRALNMCPDTQVATAGAGSPGMETMVFGPATRSAVIKWQMKVGVNPIGIFGPASRAAFTAQGNNCGGMTNLPAGCTSTTGFSSTTGQSCAVATTLPAGCTSTAGFSTTTGQSCAVPTTPTTLPAGCTSTAGFSSTTGARCDGTNTGGTTGSFTVNLTNGSRGTIEDVDLGSRADVEALEGEQNVEIYAVDIKTRNDGPLMVQAADIWFANSDTTSSLKPWEYFTKVSLMAGGQTLATIDTTSASVWGDDVDGQISVANTTDEYRVRFNGLNAVLPSNSTTKLSVAVSVMSNIDSDDESAIWYVEHGEVRIMDESGLVQNYAPQSIAGATALEERFDVDAGDAASLEIRDSSNKVDATLVEVQETTNTDRVNIYNFTLRERDGVAATLKELTARFTTSDPSVLDAKGDFENNVIKEAFLFEGSKMIARESVPNGGVVLFDNIKVDGNDFTVPANGTKNLSVIVDLFDTNDGARYEEGTTIIVELMPAGADIDSVTPGNQVSTYEATDANGNDEGTTSNDVRLSTSTSANLHELRTEGLKAVFAGSRTSKTTPTTGAEQGTFEIDFDVTAFGENLYIDRSCEIKAGGTAGNAAGQGVEYTLTTSGAGTVSSACILSLTSVTGGGNPTNSSDNTNVFYVGEDQTRRFTLQVTASATGTGTFVEAVLASINWGIASDNTNANYYNFNLTNFKTNPVSLRTI